MDHIGTSGTTLVIMCSRANAEIGQVQGLQRCGPKASCTLLKSEGCSLVNSACGTLTQRNPSERALVRLAPSAQAEAPICLSQAMSGTSLGLHPRSGWTREMQHDSAERVVTVL
jgi:hypothetical protein